MKKHLWFLALVLLLGSCDKKEEARVLDAIVVGGGISGLSCAYQLRDREVVILEKEDHVGGRVCTERFGDVYYDLGAVWAYDPKLAPQGFHTSDAIDEDRKVGMFYRGKIVYSEEVLDLLVKAGLEKENLLEILHYKWGQIEQIGDLSEESARMLQALFRAFHPGDIRDYMRVRHMDALAKWNVGHCRAGNGELADQFKTSLPARIVVKAEVVSVEDLGNKVKVTYVQDNVVKERVAKTAIVTTPAPVTKRILKSAHQRCRDFLESVRYGRFTVVAIGFQDVAFPECAGILTPESPTAGLLIQHTGNDAIHVVLAYYADGESRALSQESDESIIAKTTDIIRQLQVKFTDTNILFAQVRRWEHAAVIISEGSYGNWDEEWLRPSSRVFLAGDYTYRRFPYGMSAAIRSGENAASRVNEFLRQESHK